jgi:hypothetical protein
MPSAGSAVTYWKYLKMLSKAHCNIIAVVISLEINTITNTLPNNMKFYLSFSFSITSISLYVNPKSKYLLNKASL